MSFQDSVAPDVKSGHIIQLLLQRCQFLSIALGIQVAWANWRFKEILSIWLIVAIQQNSVEIFVQLGGLIFYQKLDAVHEFTLLAALLALSFLSAIEVDAGKGLLGLWVKSLNDLSWVLWIDSEGVKPYLEGIFLTLLNRYLVIVQEKVIKFEKGHLIELRICNFSVDYWRHYDLIGILEHHLISGCLCFNFLFHLLDNRILMCEPQNVSTWLALNDIPL